MKIRLWKTFDFEAAHAHPLPGSAASRLHGHRFYVHVSQTGEMDPVVGWLIDFRDIKTSVKPVINQLDHHLLNDIKGLGSGRPEDIGTWIEKAISTSLPFPTQVRVTCREAADYEATVLPPDPLFGYPERISFRFEAAHSLPRTPLNHKCHRLHGHSYEVQVACETKTGQIITAGPFQTAGSTQTAGPGVELLAQSLRKIHGLLNYSHLNEIPGLENSTAEILSRWIWKHLLADGVTTNLVAVGETCESCCVYTGE